MLRAQWTFEIEIAKDKQNLIKLLTNKKFMFIMFTAWFDCAKKRLRFIKAKLSKVLDK